jgi:hypothetical protein
VIFYVTIVELVPHCQFVTIFVLPDTVDSLALVVPPLWREDYDNYFGQPFYLLSIGNRFNEFFFGQSQQNVWVLRVRVGGGLFFMVK